MAELEVQPKAGGRGRVPLSGHRVVIGRSEECELSLPDTMLSRRHAEIARRGDRWYVVDLGSTNGTLLNGERLTGEWALRHGDIITVGGTKMVFTDATVEESGGRRALIDAHAYTLQDMRTRTTSRAVEMIDLEQQTRVLRMLSQATSSLLGHRPLRELFERVLDLIFEVIPAGRAAVVLLEAGVPRIRASRNREEDPLTRISGAISRRVVEQRVALLIPSVFEDRGLRARDSVTTVGIRSAMCAPLWLAPERGVAESVIGLLYVDTTLATTSFGEGDLEMLTLFANIAASKIESARLMDRNSEQDAARIRLEGQIQSAAEIQRSILPARAPDVPGCELSGDSRSCEAVGGDYHDYHWNGEELWLTLADVSGKGLAAAMLMTALRSAVHAHWREPALTTAAANINSTFFEGVPDDRYATCFLARLNPFTGRLVFVNAGHPPALVVRANGQVERLAEGGPGMGLFRTASFAEGEIILGEGDTLLIYSDGISESWPTEEEAESTLANLIRAGAATHVDVLRGDVLTAADKLRGGERHDDCTLILLRWTSPMKQIDADFRLAAERPASLWETAKIRL